MIEHVYRRAAAARGVDAVVVATDDARIADAVHRFGGRVRRTAETHRTGTDRIAEVARALDCEIVVNVQGDLPLLDPAMIGDAVAPLRADPSLRMSTICTRITDPDEYTRPSIVKVVRDRAGNALYFSRAPIPHVRASPPADTGLHGARPVEADRRATDPAEAGLNVQTSSTAETRLVESGVSRTCKHIGLYAYRRDFLLAFAALPPTPLEQAESLEQLRALEHGVAIRVVEVAQGSIEVDTLEDLERVRSAFTSASALARGAGVGAAAP